MPPMIISRPALPSMVSAPPVDTSVDVAVPGTTRPLSPIIKSLPVLPESVSLPYPPMITSLPPPPSTPRSLPPFVSESRLSMERSAYAAFRATVPLSARIKSHPLPAVTALSPDEPARTILLPSPAAIASNPTLL